MKSEQCGVSLWITKLVSHCGKYFTLKRWLKLNYGKRYDEILIGLSMCKSHTGNKVQLSAEKIKKN